MNAVCAEMQFITLNLIIQQKKNALLHYIYPPSEWK